MSTSSTVRPKFVAREFEALPTDWVRYDEEAAEACRRSASACVPPSCASGGSPPSDGPPPLSTAERALVGVIYRAYATPVEAFVRRNRAPLGVLRGRSSRDLTNDCFALVMIERRGLASFVRGEDSVFRHWLAKSVKNFLVDVGRRDRAAKRGYGRIHEPWENELRVADAEEIFPIGEHDVLRRQVMKYVDERYPSWRASFDTQPKDGAKKQTEVERQETFRMRTVVKADVRARFLRPSGAVPLHDGRS